MPALFAPAVAAAALLALAGAAKIIDPTMTVGALRAMGLPGSSSLVRAAAAGELALGALALATGHAVAFALVALSYLAFALFVAAALRRGTMIGSCGCFGRDDTPPHWSHLGLNLALAGVAAGATAWGHGPVDLVGDHPGDGLVLLGFASLLVWLLHAAYVDLPRTLAEVTASARAERST